MKATRVYYLAAALVAAVTFAGPVLAADYAPFPVTKPGTVYRWKTYKVEENGKLTLRGIYTNTIQGKTLVGDHEYIVVKRANPEGKPLGDIVYRCDNQLFGELLGPTEQALLVNWKTPATVGQSWSLGPCQVITRGEQDVHAEGVTYENCLVVDLLREGVLADRTYYDREAGWIKTILYEGGKPLAVSFRLPEDEQ